MKKVLISMMFLLTGVLVCQADEPQKFSPEKFQAEMEQFIAKEAGLTADESAKFFPSSVRCSRSSVLFSERCVRRAV